MRLRLDPNRAAQLKHVKLKHPEREVSGEFPDFLIVGPQRTGTTWLELNLRRHPEIFSATPKELYFFSRLMQSDTNRRSRDYYHFNPRNLLRKPLHTGKEIAKIIYLDFLLTGNANATQLEWYLPFFDHTRRIHKARETEAQALYGEPFRPKVFGEATATYATLHPEVIEDILVINPDIKILLMVRDPVARAWSHAKKDLMRHTGRQLHDVPKDEVIRFLTDDYQIQCGKYSDQISKWREYLPDGHLFVGFYEDLEKAPVELLLDVFSFLGVTPDRKYISDKVRKRINPTDETIIPEVYKNLLEEQFENERERLRDVHGRAWLDAQEGRRLTESA